MTFSEPVAPFGRGATVESPSGQRLETDGASPEGASIAIALPAATVEGTYLVRWRVVGADAHPARGVTAFSVGRPTTRPPESADLGGVDGLGLTLQVVSRWLRLLGFALGFGALASHAIAAGPAAPVDPRLWRLVGLGIVALIVAEPLALLAQTASLGSTEMLDPDIVSAALDSSFGRLLALRLGIAALLWVLVGVARASQPLGIRLIVGLGWLAALLEGFSAHATAVDPASFGLIVSALHVGAMSVWLGGLIALLYVGQAAASIGRVVAACLGVLAVTGVVLAAAHVGSLERLSATAYGATLAIKVAALLVVLAFAWHARRGRAGPRRLEALALAVVLGLAALLASLPPAV